MPKPSKEEQQNEPSLRLSEDSLGAPLDVREAIRLAEIHILLFAGGRLVDGCSGYLEALDCESLFGHPIAEIRLR